MSRAAERRQKAKFPVARIKRIMQTDEEIGKIAQAAPLLVSKAVELFMHTLVEAACDEVRNGGGKRMTPVHLKRCVEKTEQFDFLKDIVDRIPDPSAATDGGKGTPSSALAAASP